MAKAGFSDFELVMGIVLLVLGVLLLTGALSLEVILGVALVVLGVNMLLKRFGGPS